MEAFLRALGDGMRALNPDLLDVPPELSGSWRTGSCFITAPCHPAPFGATLYASWYITPTRHALEYLLLNPMMLALAFIAMRHKQNKLRKEIIVPENTSRMVSGLLLLLFYAAQIWYKSQRSAMWCMLMPCALFHVLLSLVCWLPGAKAHYLFDAMVQFWGLPFMALIKPDYREYSMLLEVEICFYGVHLAIVLVPIWFIVCRAMGSRGFRLERQTTVARFMFSFGISIFVYTGLATPLGLLNGININYMTSPPKGFHRFEQNYRLVSVFGLFVLQVLSRGFFLALDTVTTIAENQRAISSQKKES